MELHLDLGLAGRAMAGQARVIFIISRTSGLPLDCTTLNWRTLGTPAELLAQVFIK